MSQPPEMVPVPPETAPTMIEPTGSIEPVAEVSPAEAPPGLLEVMGRLPPALPAGGVPPVWTRETMKAIRRIATVLQARCPQWAWAPWTFTPTAEQVNVALIEAGYKSYDDVGNDVAHDPDGAGRAQIQTINWDAHYQGDDIEDPARLRVVSDGRPENGGIFPIVTVGPPDAEAHAEDIAMCLEAWQRHYATPSAVPAEAPAKANGSAPVSGVMAWACDLCQTVVRQAADGTMPSFVCPGCGATQRWRQPTMDELANVTPRERAAMTGAQPYGLGLPTQMRQADNDFYAQGTPIVLGQKAYATSEPQGAPQAGPDPETRAIADICWLLDGLPPQAQQRVVRYVRDRWS